MNGERFEEGLKTRRRVLGDDYVNRALERVNNFNRPVQKMVTEFCWNDIWNRPGLTLKERSMINLAMITALNRPHELKVHVQGALNNGLTAEEIGEIFLHCAAYCGFPAALDSFRIAEEVFVAAGLKEPLDGAKGENGSERP